VIGTTIGHELSEAPDNGTKTTKQLCAETCRLSPGLRVGLDAQHLMRNSSF
jgi:hypothetical protein